MSTKSATSKSLRTTLRHATRYFAALILLSYSQLPNAGPPEESEMSSYAGLQKRLESGNYAAVMAVDAYGEIKLLDPQGNEIEPCGRQSVHGRIVGDETIPPEQQCNLKNLDLLSLQTIQVFMTKKNPNCIVLVYGGRRYEWHAGGDGFPAWARPCHDGPH